MDQYTETQYDDDLTLGTEDYDDSYYADAEDLFAFAGDDESPISRLRSLVLSIDWEITDEVLTQFNQELVDLKDIWAGEKVNLVYVQALEKISKYIYQKKADAHPNAIKLLLSLYYNLEKIVSDQYLSDTEKHELLTEDVKRFNNLKKIIAKKPAEALAPPPPKKDQKKEEAPREPGIVKDVLLRLKALVLGIDWEITDQDLTDLKTEVLHLEKRFATSRPKLILLQGIGTLGAYIKVRKSNAHADAFKVLHLFYDSLEKIVAGNMSLEEEKSILFPAVEKFNEFKSLLAPTRSPDGFSADDSDEFEEDLEKPAGIMSPALADYDERAVVGFQEEEEAKTLGADQAVVARINDFFRDDSFPDEEGPAEEVVMVASEMLTSELPEIAGTEKSTVTEALTAFDETFGVDHPDGPVAVSADIALQGVDVEYDDDEEDEEEVVNILSDATSPAAVSPFEEEEGFSDKGLAGEEFDAPALAAFEEPAEQIPLAGDLHPSVAPDVALQGVAVETEADDDSDLEELPRDLGGLAPALLDSEEESIFSATSLEQTDKEPVVDEELVGTLENFFGDEEEPAAASAELQPTLQFEEDAEIGDVPPSTEVEQWVAAELEKEQAEPAAVGAAESVAEEEVVAAEVQSQLVAGCEEPEAESEIFVAAEIEAPAISASPETTGEEESLSLESELDEQIDDIFAGIEEPEPALGFTPAEDMVQQAEPELEPEPALAVEEDEIFAISEPPPEEVEEVVFDLYEDEEEVQPAPATENAKFSEPEPLAVASAVTSAVTAGGLTAESSSQAEEEVEKAPFRGTADEEEFIPDTVKMDDRADWKVDPLFTEDIVLAEEVSSSFQNLLGFVDSLALELDDKVISGLFQEINGLRQQTGILISEKMLLQLLSTVTQHIDLYRYEASAESFNLLKSISAALVENAEEDEGIRLNAMLNQTVKVLQWQQDMLHRQVVVKGDKLIFDDPLRHEKRSGDLIADAQQEFDTMFDKEHSGEKSERDDAFADMAAERLGEASNGSEKSSELAGRIGETSDEDTEDLDQEAGLRAEIVKMRQMLQQEIAQLRSELLKK